MVKINNVTFLIPGVFYNPSSSNRQVPCITCNNFTDITLHTTYTYAVCVVQVLHNIALCLLESRCFENGTLILTKLKFVSFIIHNTEHTTHPQAFLRRPDRAILFTGIPVLPTTKRCDVPANVTYITCYTKNFHNFVFCDYVLNGQRIFFTVIQNVMNQNRQKNLQRKCINIKK